MGSSFILHMKLNNNCFLKSSETRFFGYDPESKEYNAEAHRDRIMGKHVANYMAQLKDDDEEAYKRQFARFIKNGIEPNMVSASLSAFIEEKTWQTNKFCMI